MGKITLSYRVLILIISIILVLLTVIPQSIVSKETQKITGFVYYNGLTIDHNISVGIINKNSGSMIYPKTNSSGYFEGIIDGEDGDKIEVFTTYKGIYKSNSTDINFDSNEELIFYSPSTKKNRRVFIR